MADEVDQVGGVLAIMDRKGSVQSDLVCVCAQEPRPDRVERSRPSQAIRERAGQRPCGPGGNPFDPARHFGGGAAREGEQQDPTRIRTTHNDMCNSMHQCIGLA